MELTRYSKYPSRRRGACHGLEATAFVERAIKRSGWKVRLAAQKLSSRAEKRLRRSVWVKQGGRWRDLAKLELQAGLALWLPEPRRERPQPRVRRARPARPPPRARRSTTPAPAAPAPTRTCRSASPSTGTPTATTPRTSTASGSTSTTAAGASCASAAGGCATPACASAQDRVPGYRLPAATVVPAGETLRVRVGCGAASALEQHWCLQESAFENVGALAPGRWATAPTCSTRRATCARGRSTRAWSRAATRWPARCG